MDDQLQAHVARGATMADGLVARARPASALVGAAIAILMAVIFGGWWWLGPPAVIMLNVVAIRRFSWLPSEPVSDSVDIANR